jgi:hypothetical protein
MAWRWADGFVLPRRRFYEAGNMDATEEPERPGWVPPSTQFQPAEPDKNAGWIEPEAEYEERCLKAREGRLGYCGLAGEPNE